jgi:hypothetical protein
MLFLRQLKRHNFSVDFFEKEISLTPMTPPLNLIEDQVISIAEEDIGQEGLLLFYLIPKY